MSKLKKLVAGALAAAICTVSFAAPATADAATYCNHTIYRASSTAVSSTREYCGKHIVAMVWNNNYTVCRAIYKDCYAVTTKYSDTYACHKCSYTYTGSHTSTTHSVSH